jgi:hypothetical protein
MHKLAEYGIAAHVAYKEGAAADPKREKMTWLRQLVEAEGDQDPAEFLESLKVDLFEDEVFVFTPKGEVKNLSAGSPRSTSPTRFTPTSATPASAPRSTARSCRCTTSCAPATSSRC